MMFYILDSFLVLFVCLTLQRDEQCIMQYFIIALGKKNQTSVSQNLG